MMREVATARLVRLPGLLSACRVLTANDSNRH
jgi:hypothetical protein